MGELRGRPLPVTTAKLTEAKVKEIRRLLSEDEISQTELAKQYGVSRSAISDLHRGKTWGWVY